MMTYPDWCRAHNCTHAHCPCGCEHPQPFVSDGALYCGKCFHDDNQLCAMIPCIPENCT